MCFMNKTIKSIIYTREYNNSLCKGLFWLIKNDVVEDVLLCVVEPLRIDGNEEQSEEKKMNHERTWSILDKGITRGKPYNYFPRGRVEIKRDKAVIFLNHILNDKSVLNRLIEVFGLKEENGISEIKIKNDNSWHYRYLLRFN